MWRRLFTLGLLLLLPVAGWGVAAQLSTTFQQLTFTPTFREALLIRCDNSGSLTGADTPAGETCESGDWSLPLDCRDMTHLKARFYEYGAGSGEAKIWSCIRLGGAGTNDGGTVPGTEAPGGSPSAADPDPLCVDLTAGAGITDFDGLTTGTIELNLSDQSLDSIVGEIEDCTGDCDSTLVVSCSR